MTMESLASCFGFGVFLGVMNFNTINISLETVIICAVFGAVFTLLSVLASLLKL